jgi:hypothetical protein
MAAELEDLIPQILKLAIGHDPEPATFNSDPYVDLSKIDLSTPFSVFRGGHYPRDFPAKILYPS